MQIDGDVAVAFDEEEDFLAEFVALLQRYDATYEGWLSWGEDWSGTFEWPELLEALKMTVPKPEAK